MSDSVIVPFVRVPGSEDLDPPVLATSGSAAFDLRSAADGVVAIAPHEIRLIPTGLRMAIPAGFEGLVRMRSGLSRDGLMLANGVGTIDSDYRGEIGVIVLNAGDRTRLIGRGQRIAQLAIRPVPAVRLQEVDSLDETERGSGGFGSTGSD